MKRGPPRVVLAYAYVSVFGSSYAYVKVFSAYATKNPYVKKKCPLLTPEARASFSSREGVF